MTDKTPRRTFLKMLGVPAMAAAMPDSIARALAAPANHRTGTIRDIEHIVILMQENRSFDHYFGTLRGVRGFADPHPVVLPSGQDVWHQPYGNGYLMPFRPGENVGLQFLPDPPHGFNDTHAAWNEGRYDRWVPNKGVTTMTYHTREDLPYHYALADAFTVCDAYYCSVMGPTDPNRYHMWTGWVGNDGSGGGPVITNAELGYDWSTYPERLQSAGISWKIYQDIGYGLDAAGFWGWTDNPYIGNYGDNSLLYFHQYQNAVPGTPLAENAKTGTNVLAQALDPHRLIDIFREDVGFGRLPQVTWIVAPEAYSEHPNWPPNYGAWYVSQFVEVLASHPEVWAKTALFVTFDEEGGFFDHLVPPTPPQTAAHGFSTVPITNEIFPGDADHPSAPYGLGVRVPMLVVSPWSKGGWVNSQVFDHTSLIRFIEARFADEHPGLIETNITPWRRTVAGDLTTAFDFARPDAWKQIALPSTDAYVPPDFERHPDDVPVPPATQRLPAQERGVRPARWLPYVLDAAGVVDATDGSFRIDFRNNGTAAAVFHVRSGNPSLPPRTYTVGAHTSVSGHWDVTAIGTTEFDLSVYGPNGFLRTFKGAVSSDSTRVETRLAFDSGSNALVLDVLNVGSSDVELTIRDAYTQKTIEFAVTAGSAVSRRYPVERSWGWYDLTLATADDAPTQYRFAGHYETGEQSFSDPLMGGLV
jgi:phospholipase C